MRNSPRPLFLHQTLQLALCIGAGCVLLASAKPRFALPDGEAWFMTPEKVFPLLQSPMAASFTPLQSTLVIAHSDLKSCVQLLVKLPTNSSCADVASRGSLELCSDFYELHASALSGLFCELVWPTTSRLSRCCSLTFPLHNNSTYSWTGTALAGQKFEKLTCWKVRNVEKVKGSEYFLNALHSVWQRPMLWFCWKLFQIIAF
jgi:hypothetical protein